MKKIKICSHNDILKYDLKEYSRLTLKAHIENKGIYLNGKLILFGFYSTFNMKYGTIFKYKCSKKIFGILNLLKEDKNE